MSDLVKTIQSISMLSRGMQISLKNAQILLDAAAKFNHEVDQVQREAATMVDEMMD